MHESQVSSALPFAEANDVVEVRLLSSQRVALRVQRLFHMDDRYGTEYSALRGRLMCIWTVQHTRRSEEGMSAVYGKENLSEGDQEVVKKYLFCDYSSPSDIRAAKQREDAWSKWKKPLVKPGDVVVMLSSICRVSDGQEPALPTMAQACSLCRLFVVHRFWAESGKKHRHVFVERCEGHGQLRRSN